MMTRIIFTRPVLCIKQRHFAEAEGCANLLDALNCVGHPGDHGHHDCSDDQWDPDKQHGHDHQWCFMSSIQWRIQSPAPKFWAEISIEKLCSHGLISEMLLWWWAVDLSAAATKGSKIAPRTSPRPLASLPSLSSSPCVRYTGNTRHAPLICLVDSSRAVLIPLFWLILWSNVDGLKCDGCKLKMQQNAGTIYIYATVTYNSYDLIWKGVCQSEISQMWESLARLKAARQVKISIYNQTINKTCYLSHQFSFSKSKKWEHGENVVLHM